MKLEGKFKSKFVLVLALGTIIILLIQALNFFGLIDLNKYLSAILAILIGVGLLMEGNIRAIIGLFKKGTKIDIPQTVHIITAVLGLIVAVFGILMLAGVALPTQALGILGFVNAAAIIPVVIEYFI